MLLLIKADGFRSLADFQLTINPGLNILVGPNGGGKTNIVQLFEFLSTILTHSIGEAVSQSGGAGAVFRKTDEETYQQSLKVDLVGRARTSRSRTRYINYRYTFDARISDQRDVIFYQHQQIFAKKSTRIIKTDELLAANTEWNLVIEQLTDNDLQTKIKIHSLDRRRFGPRYFVGPDITKPQILSVLSNLILRYTGNETSLLSSAAYAIPDLDLILQDFAGESVFNIIPSRVKQSEDSARPPGIQKDGSGLAATLYALTRTSQPRNVMFSRTRSNIRGRLSTIPFEYSRITMVQIIAFAKLVNPAIMDIVVHNDPFDNQLKILVSIKTKDASVSLPFSAMSDGTIKWISLITALLTYRTVFSVEEPENYIHPLMQKEVLSIMRENTADRQQSGFILLSTHSETLLNAANPREVIVVTMRDGITVARRPLRQSMLQKLIADSGFGLGHWYMTGALDDG